MAGEKQSVINLLHGTDSAPLLHSQRMAEWRKVLRLIALQHQCVGHAVGQRIAAAHLWLGVLLNLELHVIVPEVRRVVRSGWPMCHIEHLLHQCQRGLLGGHPCLRSTVHRLYLVNHLLTVRVVHLRELRRKDRIHLVLVVLVCDFHIGKGQESG